MTTAAAQIERRFRAAIEAIDGVVWTNNADGEMIGEQPDWAELTGQSFVQYQGYGWAGAIHPEDAERTLTAWRKAVAARAPFIFEHRVRRADGVWRNFAINAIPIEDANGTIIEWLGVHRDITDRRADEGKIRQIADTFTSLFTSNPFGIYVVDADFNLAQVSQGARFMFANVDPLIGRDFTEVLEIVWSKPFAARAITLFRHTLSTGEPYVNADAVGERADTHTAVSYDWRIERIILPDGRYGVVCYFYDLSERKAQEDSLHRAIAEKDLLAREIDHRVKNSLMIVASVLSMQRSEVISDEAKRALSEASDRVLAVARVHESLHKSHELGVIAFGNYLEQMCVDVQKSIGSRAVKLDVKAMPVHLPADIALTLALIANELITNAFKHGVAAGAKKISVELEVRGDRLALTVGDDGVVLAPGEPVAKIGLGLNLVDAMIQQLSATHIKPVPGAPMIFRIEIAMPVLADMAIAA